MEKLLMKEALVLVKEEFIERMREHFNNLYELEQ